MEINFFAAIDLTRLLLPVMRNTPGEKSILLVSTPSGLFGMPGRFAYSASKAAAQAVMESIRIEHKADKIHTVIFCPGYTKTALRTKGLAPDGSALREDQVPGAQTPERAAHLLVNAIEKRRRYAFTDLNGRGVFLLRSLCPPLLERLVAKKLRKDFEDN
jgi:short-subunit dehydrogenase